MKVEFLLVFLSFIFISCNKNKNEDTNTQTDEYGVVISQPHIWKTYLHEDDTPQINSSFNYPITFQNNIIIPTTKSDGSVVMTMINSSNGAKIWSWGDIFNNQYSRSDLNIYMFVSHNNFLTWQTSDKSYCINLTNGSTNWKFIRNNSFDTRINPYKNEQFFTFGLINRPDGYDEQAAFSGNISNGEIIQYIRPEYSCEYVAPITNNGGVGGVIYVNELGNHNNILLVTYAEPLPEWQVRSMFGLYNTETETWIYERVELAEPHWNNSVFHTPIIHNEKIYANVGYSIVCHDLMTGEQLWRRNFNNDFLFSGFIIEEGKIIAMCEDTILYCLEPETGSTIWETEAAGTSSRMSYLNGVVYFVGGSTRKLHAVDISTGSTVWRIDSRNMGDEYGKFGPNAVYVIPGENGEKGKVIALTSRYAICYEAYQ